MNNYFDDIFKKVLLDEQGYVNDKDDTGGETYLGISRVNNPNAKMWKLIDEVKAKTGLTNINAKLAAIPEIINEAKLIYKNGYWNPLRLSELNSKQLCHQIFDEAVNAGVSLARKLAYELVKLPNESKITDQLISKLKEYGS